MAAPGAVAAARLRAQLLNDPARSGWADRTFVTAGHGAVVTSNGSFPAAALVTGRVAGTWRLSDGAGRPRRGRLMRATPLRPPELDGE